MWTCCKKKGLTPMKINNKEEVKNPETYPELSPSLL